MVTALMNQGERVLTTSVRQHQPTFLNGYVTFVTLEDDHYVIKIRYAGRVARENGITYLDENWPHVNYERGPGFVTLEVWLPA
jgi:hypothetical protein